MEEKMQKVMFILMSIFVLPGSVFAQGNWISFTSNAVGTPPIVEVLESNNSRTVIHVTIPGMWVRDTLVNGTTYHMLKIPDYGTMYNVGEPQLPAIRELVAIPPISNVGISVTNTVTPLILNGYTVYPYQEAVPEGQPPAPFIIDTVPYSTNSFYPGNTTELSDPAVWRDVRVVHSALYPITFNPVTHQLNACYDFTVVLDYWGVSNINILQGGYTAGVSPEYASMYRSQIINYDWLGIPEGEQYRSFAYLVITTNDYDDAIQPFVFWKQKKGFDTEVEVVDLGSSPEDIKAIIEADYESRRTEWVLLVGDDHRDTQPNDIPTYRYYPPPAGSYEIYDYSDYWYTLLTGDDDYPELAIGRFPPVNEAQVDTMIYKIFAYERTPCPRWDIDEMLLVVHWDATTHSLPCKRYIRDYVLEPMNFEVDTAFGMFGATNQDVIEYIEGEEWEDFRGVSIVNYRGHGWYDCWLNWDANHQSFYTSHVRSLENFWYPDSGWVPLVFNLCCTNGCIVDDDEVLIEAWLAAGGGGGAGALGASNRTWPEYSNIFDTTLFEIAFNPSIGATDVCIYEIGKAINYAKVQVIKLKDADDKSLSFARQHIWAGDPSLWIWTDSTGNLATLTVTHPRRIGTEPTQFRVTVEDGAGGANAPVAHALVCLYKKETVTHDLYERGFTDRNGQITFNICPTTAGDLYVTVTKHHSNGDYYYNYKPYEGTCRVLWSPGGPMSGDYSSVIPRFFSLGQSYPNPFKQNTEIKYQIPETGSKQWVCLKVYNSAGRLVRTLINEPQNPGYYNVLWDGIDDFSEKVSSGVYFYRIEAGDFTAMRKIVVMR
ncbi:MAG: T9SS type A sorting domain-containing protein [Anaerolineales bacterium]|nr:T9SS type A sorting domain-containing protein [Anaerolineales bacterium]